jgi:ParB family transcriptional regulator, chromosome partitioning protein
MAKDKQVLGKGLEVLFSSQPEPEVKEEKSQESEQALFIETNKIKTNPYQPREEFNEIELRELADSIKQKGIIQPITVRKNENGEYELIAGERRLRASKLAGLEKLPAYVLDVTSKEDLLEISLIENIQRKDLNAIEAAHGYQRLIDECNLTQEQVAERIGKSRSVVTNYLRILKLPDEIQQSIRKGEINEGHARAILSIDDAAGQIALWKRILHEKLPVRQAEQISKKLKKPAEKKIFISSNQDKAAISFLESKFREHFGTKVRLLPKSKTTGEIIIEYYTAEDLERIIEMCRKT